MVGTETEISSAAKPPDECEQLPAVRSRRTSAAVHGAFESSLAIRGLFCIAVIFMLQMAATILVPIALGLLIYFLLSPLTERLVACWIPRPVAALLSVSVLCAPLAFGVTSLADPAAEWLRQGPTSIAEMRQAFADLSEPLEQVRSASQAVDAAVGELTGGDEPDPPTVRLREPGLLESALDYLPAVLGTVVLSFALGFLLLLGGRQPIFRALVWSRKFASRKRAVRAMTRIQRDISQYLTTVLLINIGLGTVAAACFWLLEVPNPVLWGVVAGVLNFAPYVGAAFTTIVLVFVGAAAFSAPAEALTPAGVFLLLTSAESQLITPIILGRRLAVNPSVALLSVICMGWLWGLAGALIAIPMLMGTLILLETMSQTTTDRHSVSEAGLVGSARILLAD